MIMGIIRNAGRIERRIWLIGEFTFAGLAIMLVLLGKVFEWLPAWLPWVSIAISFILGMLTAWSSGHRNWDFKLIFGFIPTKSKDLIERIKQRHIEQGNVTTVLHVLAIKFDEAAKKQEEFSRAPRRLVATQGEVKLLVSEVRRAKKAFWQAHAMAKREEYGVFGSYKDYTLILIDR